MPAPDLITGLYSTTGQIIGLTIQGYVLIQPGQGILMQDANLAYWMIQIGTDGRLSTLKVSL